MLFEGIIENVLKYLVQPN